MINIIKINDRSIEYFIKGEGKKTIAIMVGMGCSLYDWLDIAEEISTYAKVIIIHRPGVGNSDSHDEGSSTEIAAKDLNGLLNVLNINEKVILVGHSYGGLCVQHYGRLYPEMVESIVLVESACMEAYKIQELNLPVMDEFASDQVYLDLWTKYSNYSKEQLSEEIKTELTPRELELSKEIQKEILKLNISPKFYRTQLDELLDLRNNVRKIKEVGEFPKVPLKILVRDSEYSIEEMISEGAPREEAETLEDALKALACGLKDLSPMSELLVIEKSNHCMNETRPDAIIEVIKELI